MPPGPGGVNHCHFCGATARRLDIDHLDGDEANGSEANLARVCRPCNTAKGLHFKRVGRGVRTAQYNPRRKGPPSSYRSYMHLMSIARGPMSTTAEKDEAWRRILAVSKSRRSDYASQLYDYRRQSGSAPEQLPF